jgi:hypothetical protein
MVTRDIQLVTPGSAPCHEACRRVNASAAYTLAIDDRENLSGRIADQER